MINAKKELLSFLKSDIKSNTKIKCALITYRKWFHPSISIILKVNHSEDELNKFLKALNFNYNNGAGHKQELFGTIWLEDGSWLSRRENNGVEWWEHNVLPKIPFECISFKPKKK